MKFILALTDSRRKSIAFVTDSLKIISLKDAIQAVKSKSVEGMHVAKRGETIYLRSNASTVRINMDAISIPWYQIFAPYNSGLLLKAEVLKMFWNHYRKEVEKSKERGDILVAAESYYVTTKQHVQKILGLYKEDVFVAAKHYDIDPYLLAGVFIDEIVRLFPFLEGVAEYILLHTVNKNVSVGVGQVTLENIRGLIQKGYYNPNPNDKDLSSGQVYKLPLRYFYKYGLDKKHSVFFAAAKMRADIDEWAPFKDISKLPEIVATVYSYHATPHDNPKPSNRGLQIANEFYPLAKEMLDNV